ncbi:MAG: hypothetical protein ABSA17_02685 [Rhabdochlamydiaceae bacterium]|jgi:hypothetical protein
MTTPIDRSPFSLSSAAAFTVFTGWRLIIGWPLDGLYRREIIQDASTLKVIRSTPLSEFKRGFQPTAIKYFTATPLQITSTWFASRITPTDLPPAIRGVLFGIITSTIEGSVKNTQNVLVTRFIQGDKWNVVRKEGSALFGKGAFPTVLHRGFSSCIFWGLYEPLHKRFPNHSILVGTAVGLVQTGLTTPLANLAPLMHAKQDPNKKSHPTTMWDHVKELKKTQSLARMLLGRGLGPRGFHSLLTSGPLMGLYNYFNVVQRQ